MNERIKQIENKIDALWQIDEYDTEINQKYGDVEIEFIDIVEEINSRYDYDHHSYFKKLLQKANEIRNKLKKFKDERDIYDEDSELDMMFPNGVY